MDSNVYWPQIRKVVVMKLCYFSIGEGAHQTPAKVSPLTLPPANSALIPLLRV
eukprot:TRINITY_DN3679_c0_g1_i1.p4 TRINITY_DN3679_c0_g1~~TRINITY_DN3679_c0_g1_i1.p4  ORF type:complete len:53 (+),score=21.44 TRINITY_DN3679_c0_g1_i1:269-427(+)